MAFEPERTRAPSGIGTIRIIVESNVASIGAQVAHDARFDLVIKFSDGSSKWRSGDLMSHLKQSEKIGLSHLMASLRDRAIEEILPAGVEEPKGSKKQ